MLLDKYEQEGLLINKNFKDNTKEADTVGYRGELVITPGEVSAADGRKGPPSAIVEGAVVLATGDKLKLVVGFLDNFGLLEKFLEKYKDDFAEDMRALLYVVNITQPMQLDVGGRNVILIPLVDGIPWNEFLDELALEKSDFKGQSSADKIVTAYKEFLGYKPKYATVSFDEASGFTADKKREARGPV